WESCCQPVKVLLVLRCRLLPLTTIKVSKMHMLETEPFADTFGSKAQRKRPKLAVASFDEMINRVETTLGMLNALLFSLRTLSFKLSNKIEECCVSLLINR